MLAVQHGAEPAQVFLQRAIGSRPASWDRHPEAMNGACAGATAICNVCREIRTKMRGGFAGICIRQSSCPNAFYVSVFLLSNGFEGDFNHLLGFLVPALNRCLGFRNNIGGNVTHTFVVAPVRSNGIGISFHFIIWRCSPRNVSIFFIAAFSSFQEF